MGLSNTENVKMWVTECVLQSTKQSEEGMVWHSHLTYKQNLVYLTTFYWFWENYLGNIWTIIQLYKIVSTIPTSGYTALLPNIYPQQSLPLQTLATHPILFFDLARIPRYAKLCSYAHWMGHTISMFFFVIPSPLYCPRDLMSWCLMYWTISKCFTII